LIICPRREMYFLDALAVLYLKTLRRGRSASEYAPGIRST
jgi:hypothetical protein